GGRARGRDERLRLVRRWPEQGPRRRRQAVGRQGGRGPAVSEAAQPAQVARRPDPDGASGASGTDGDVAALLTLEEVPHDRTVSGLISAADRVMEGLGFTEHGFRHATLVARIAFNLLHRLGFDDRTATLACVAGYLHDIGNSVARENHGPTGALFAYDTLKDRMRLE